MSIFKYRVTQCLGLEKLAKFKIFTEDNNFICILINDIFHALIIFLYMVVCGGSNVMDYFGITFPLFLLVNLPRCVASFLFLFLGRKENNIFSKIKYVERFVTFFIQAIFYFIYLIVMGVNYQKEADYDYSGGVNSFMESLIIWGFFVTIGDFLIEAYFMMKFIKYYETIGHPTERQVDDLPVQNQIEVPNLHGEELHEEEKKED